MSDGINIGFRKATGNWTMAECTDDSLKPGALKAVKTSLLRNQPSTVIYGCWDYVW
jgi:hypothetical protein